MASIESRPWTILAYLASKTADGLENFDRAMEDDIKAMCDAADLAQQSVAVQVNFNHRPGVFRATLMPRKGRDVKNRKPRPSRGFKEVKLKRRGLFRDILHQIGASDLYVQENRADLDLATRGELHAFLSFGRRECPSNRSIIFFDGHAFGPMGLFYELKPGHRDPSPLRLTDLAKAIRSDDGPADVILFRDCFVDTLEMAYQLRGVARYFVASQSEVRIKGVFPWLNLMASLLPHGETSEVAAAIALQIYGFFQVRANRGLHTDMPFALIDVDEVRKVTRPLAALVDVLDGSRGNAPRCRAYAGALEGARRGEPGSRTRPGDPALIDILAMCHNLRQLGDDPAARLAKNVDDALRNRVIVSQHAHQHQFHGLSMFYKPTAKRQISASFILASNPVDMRSDDRYYKTLALSKATGWNRIALNPLTA